MNDKELDRLFRQKLDPMEVTPSAGAWEQLEAGLQHKKKKRLWVYVSQIAAAILLLLGSWGAFEYSQQLLPTEQLATGKDGSGARSTSAPVPQEVAQHKKTEEETVPQPAATETVKEAGEASKTAAIAQAVKTKAAQRKQEAKVRQKEDQKPFVAALATAPAKAQAQEATPTENLPTAAGKPLQAQALAGNLAQEEISEPLVIKEEVIISYRVDDEPAASATMAAADTAPEKEKENSARKILGFFKKVTDTSGAGLAELREAKNELLSLNRLSRPE